MKIDAHNHIGEKKGTEVMVEEIISEMDKSGIDKACVFTFPEQIDNEYIINSVKKYPERLYGFVTINPWSTTSEKDLAQAFENKEIYGLKLHPVKHGYAFDNHELLDGIFKICEEYKKPILAFGGANVFTSPNMFEEMAKTFPEVNIIMAHGGQMYETKSAISVAKRNKNIFIETSSMFALRIENLLKEKLIDQIIFGTDYPYGNYELEIDKIKLVAPDKEDQNKIFSENLLRILEGEI